MKNNYDAMPTVLDENGQERRLLFKVSSLTKYFPVKRKAFSRKRDYVHANEAISLNIYEGETLGLVGESGCGKSTFGRTLLQIYPATAGSILYYGATLADVDAKYVYDTIKSIPSKFAGLAAATDELQEMLEKLDQMKREETSADELAAFQNKVLDKSREYEDHYADMVRIAGGLLLADNLNQLSELLRQAYVADVDYCKVKNAIQRYVLQSEVNPSIKESNAAEIKKLEPRLKELDAKREAAYAKLDDLRESVKDKPGYDKLQEGYDPGVNLSKLSRDEMRPLRQEMQIIFQDPYSSLDTRMTLGNIIGEGVIAHDIFPNNKSKEYNDYIRQIMQECGLAPYFIHRYPHQFSGGQRQRIGISRALAVQPRFVVCDEAVSALDVSIQSQVINLLSDLKAQRQLTYLFITHDLSVVKYISDRIAVMYLGQLAELTSSDELFRNPLHPYSQALLRAIPRADVESGAQDLAILAGDVPSAVHPPKGCRFHTRCEYCREECSKFEPALHEVEPGHFVACHLMNMPQEEREAFMLERDKAESERQKTAI